MSAKSERRFSRITKKPNMSRRSDSGLIVHWVSALRARCEQRPVSSIFFVQLYKFAQKGWCLMPWSWLKVLNYKIGKELANK